MEISNLELINSKVVSYGATLLPVVKNRTNEEIKFLYEFGFRKFGSLWTSKRRSKLSRMETILRSNFEYTV